MGRSLVTKTRSPLYVSSVRLLTLLPVFLASLRFLPLLSPPWLSSFSTCTIELANTTWQDPEEVAQQVEAQRPVVTVRICTAQFVDFQTTIQIIRLCTSTH